MSAVFTPTRHKLTVDAYHALARAGHLTEDDRVELINGEMIEMAPIGGPHMTLVNRLNRILVMAIGERGVVSVQNPVSLPPYSEPQPDLTVLAPTADRLDGGVPGPQDVLLIVEVADTTLRYDRGTKLPIYAKHAVPEVWIVAVEDRLVEVYRGPVSESYEQRLAFRVGEVVSPQRFPDVRIDVGRLFSS